MKRILILGAGKSTTCLIDYLLELAPSKGFVVAVADGNKELVEMKTKGHPNAMALELDASSDLARQELIALYDIVISMLPPNMHLLVAKDCLTYSKHLLCASYVDPAIREMGSQIEEKGLLFLFEMGLDPGIDHMSAMYLFEKIKLKGGKIVSFKSHCGGLVAPESDDNSWHYKISWNSRNVVQAGMAGALYLENGKKVSIPYQQLFNENQLVNIPGLGKLSWYANRDSMSYLPLYQLEGIDTFIRTTLRYPDFNYGWNIIINLSLTSQEKWITSTELSAFDFLVSHIKHFQIESKFRDLVGLGINEIEAELMIRNQSPLHSQGRAIKLLDDLGLFDKEIIIHNQCQSSFDAILQLAELKWALKKEDRDMIVMLHEVEYLNEFNEKKGIKSSLVIKGKDPLRTAMASTVGLPLGIAAKLILEGKLQSSGLKIPVLSEIYHPVLQELEKNGIQFVEESY